MHATQFAETAAARSRGHNYVTGDDQRRFPSRQESGLVEEAIGAARWAARRAGGWLWGSPLLTVALIIGAGFLVEQLVSRRR